MHTIVFTARPNHPMEDVPLDGLSGALSGDKAKLTKENYTFRVERGKP